ncbi:unnamed protein product [Calypogeia fissa]
MRILPLQVTHHHIIRRNCFVCSPFVLHEMLSSVDAKLSETLEPAISSVKVDDSWEVLDGRSLSDLLLRCAQAISAHDTVQCLQILNSLAGRVSEQGDSGERVGSYFTKALANRFLKSKISAGGSEEITEQQPSLLHIFRIPEAPSQGELHAAHLALNRVTPFLRFAHLTANQAIVEVMEGEEVIHLVDFEIMQGVQWPPLMQALAQRKGGPPRLRLTGIGPAEDVLHQTGHRLTDFARTLDLPFEYVPLVVGSLEKVKVEMFNKREGEAFAVNCVLQLHRLLEKGLGTLETFLETIHSLTPKVFTLAEREANHNHQLFLDRLTEAFQHYTALFDSLEATLPPKNFDRVTVEEVWFGREIANIISCDGSEWIERHQRFERWREVMNKAGFRALPPSTFALAQAKLLLRLHYPSEGYRLFETDDCLSLGWQDQALFTVSSWQRQVQHD